MYFPFSRMHKYPVATIHLVIFVWHFNVSAWWQLHQSQTSLGHAVAALACSIAGRPCVSLILNQRCRTPLAARLQVFELQRVLWFCFLPSQWNAGAAAGDGGAQAFVHPHPQVDSFSSSHFLCKQQDWCQLGDNCELWPCSSLHFWFVWKAFSWLIPWVSSVGEASWCICQDSRRWAYRDFHCKSSVPDPWVLWIGDLACKTAVQAMQKMFDPQMQMLLEKRLGANLTIPQRLKYYCTRLWEEMVLHISGLHMCHSFCWWSMLRLPAPGICWSTQAPWGPSSQSVVVPWPWLLVCCSVEMEEMWPSLTGIRDRSFFQKHCFVCLVVMAEYWYTRSDFLFQIHLHMMRSWPGNSVNHAWRARVISLQYSTDFK